MNPDAGYDDKRSCRYCKEQTMMHITLKEWVVAVTCNSCSQSYELERLERY